MVVSAGSRLVIIVAVLITTGLITQGKVSHYMLWFQRPDGVRVRNLPAMRRIIPYVMPGRNDSAAYIESRFDVTQTRKWLWAYNRTLPSDTCTFLHLFLYHIGKVITEFPEVDRFVSGRRFYQRTTPTVSLVVKEALDSDSPAYTVKLPIAGPEESLPAYSEKIAAILGNAREHQKTTEWEMDLLLRLPDPLIRLVFTIRNLLDSWNLLPGFLIRDDPLCTSLFVSNLGSLGAPDTYHHLFEYGTCSLFAVISSLQRVPVVDWDGTTELRDILPIRWTLDTRAADAFVFSRALPYLRNGMENPVETLGNPEAVATGKSAIPPANGDSNPSPTRETRVE